MKSLVVFPFFTFVAHSAIASLEGNFYHQVHNYKHNYKAHADGQRLDDINRLLASPSSSSNSQPSSPSPYAILATAAAPSFQIYTENTLPVSPPPPAACVSALTVPVSCNYTIQYMSYPFDDTSLAAMCTSTCTSSLQAYRSNVVRACQGYGFPGPNNSTYAATLAVDTIAAPYSVQCRQDATTGQFCPSVLAAFTTSDPNQGILGYPQNELCSSCLLGTLNSTLSSAITFSNALYNMFEAALRTCGPNFNSYNITPPSSTSYYTHGEGSSPQGSNVTSSPVCSLTGREVTISSSSDCNSLSTQFSVTPDDILANNPTLRLSNCTSGIGAGTRLCLPQACTLYTAKANQTCNDVVNDVNHRGLSGSQNITIAQLQSFNPSLGFMCTTISPAEDTVVCVTPHGGFIDIGNDGGGAVPTATPTARVLPPGPTVDGTTSDCGAWYLVKNDDFCQRVALNNSVTLDDFLRMNPEVNANCTNLWAGYNYCVTPFPPFESISAPPIITANATSGTIISIPLTTATTSTPFPLLPSYSGIPAPTNVADGTITNGCGYYYDVSNGDNCTNVEELFDMSDADFKNYNDNPSTPCPSLIVGSAVCVQVLNATDALPPTPTNAAPGSAPSGCAKWYTIISGDGCISVESKFGLTAAEFFALNPEIKTDCTNLALGVAYCVKAISFGSSTTTTGVPIPTNVISGTDTKDCAKYDTVINGDSCPQIESRNGISDLLFRSLNPEVNGACTNLQLGGAYCVAAISGYTPTGSPSSTGVPIPTNVVSGTDTKDCTKYDIVISGDSCPQIESRNGISDSLFRALNPEINSQCTNLQLGGAYCVKAIAGFTPTATTSTPTQTPTGPPSNLAQGSWTNCTTYYTIVSGDNCQPIDTAFKIAFSDFLRWNPEVVAACTNIQLGAAYCVKGSNGCPKIYTVASGDSCGAIESKLGLSDAQLRSVNPWLDAKCDLQLGQNLCAVVH